MESDRGISSVVGYVLLLGITVTAAGLTVYVGSGMIDSISSQNQDAQAEQSMSQFSSEASLVALGDLEYREVDFGNIGNEQIEVRESVSTIEVYVVNESDTTHLLDKRSLGAVVYKNRGTEIAYEGGGVWRKQNGESEMISPPEYHYQGRTLTFPVIRVIGDDGASGPTQLAVEQLNTNEKINYKNPITEGEVYVTVESDYCEGWREFFLERTGGNVTECNSGAVTAKLVVPHSVSVDQGIGVAAYLDEPNSGSTFPDNVEESAELVEVDEAINAKIESAKNENDNDNSNGCISKTSFEGDCTLTEGVYYIDQSVQLEGRVSFDTSEGPIDIVVDGTLDISGQELRNVDTSTDNSVQYYIGGDLKIRESTVKTNSSEIESSRNVFWVRGEGVATESNAPDVDMDAIIYAPNAKISVNGKLGTIRGAIYADSVMMNGGGGPNSKIVYDEALEGFTLELESNPSSITYLHLSENRIRIKAN